MPHATSTMIPTTTASHTIFNAKPMTASRIASSLTAMMKATMPSTNLRKPITHSFQNSVVAVAGRSTVFIDESGGCNLTRACCLNYYILVRSSELNSWPIQTDDRIETVAPCVDTSKADRFHKSALTLRVHGEPAVRGNRQLYISALVAHVDVPGRDSRRHKRDGPVARCDASPLMKTPEIHFAARRLDHRFAGYVIRVNRCLLRFHL